MSRRERVSGVENTPLGFDKYHYHKHLCYICAIIKTRVSTFRNFIFSKITNPFGLLHFLSGVSRNRIYHKQIDGLLIIADDSLCKFPVFMAYSEIHHTTAVIYPVPLAALRIYARRALFSSSNNIVQTLYTNLADVF